MIPSSNNYINLYSESNIQSIFSSDSSKSDGDKSISHSDYDNLNNNIPDNQTNYGEFNNNENVYNNNNLNMTIDQSESEGVDPNTPHNNIRPKKKIADGRKLKRSSTSGDIYT